MLGTAQSSPLATTATRLPTFSTVNENSFRDPASVMRDDDLLARRMIPMPMEGDNLGLGNVLGRVQHEQLGLTPSLAGHRICNSLNLKRDGIGDRNPLSGYLAIQRYQTLSGQIRSGQDGGV